MLEKLECPNDWPPQNSAETFVAPGNLNTAVFQAFVTLSGSGNGLLGSRRVSGPDGRPFGNNLPRDLPDADAHHQIALVQQPQFSLDKGQSILDTLR
jgi:hypothetical protein